MKRTFSSFGVALWIAFTAPMAAAVPNRLDLIQLPPPDGASSVSYTGAKLTLNFQDIDLRAVLQQIADVAGLNLVTSDEVQGSITLRLKDVPWDQALDLVLQTKGLDKRVKAGVLLVARIFSRMGAMGNTPLWLTNTSIVTVSPRLMRVLSRLWFTCTLFSAMRTLA